MREGGATLKQLADIFHISRSRISQICGVQINEPPRSHLIPGMAGFLGLPVPLHLAKRLQS